MKKLVKGLTDAASTAAKAANKASKKTPKVFDELKGQTAKDLATLPVAKLDKYKEKLKRVMDETTDGREYTRAYNLLGRVQKGKDQSPKFQKMREEATKSETDPRQYKKGGYVKSKMMGGGMVGKKAHMYAAGGSVVDNRKKR
jgi:hypothetical protein